MDDTNTVGHGLGGVPHVGAGELIVMDPERGVGRDAPLLLKEQVVRVRARRDAMQADGCGFGCGCRCQP